MRFLGVFLIDLTLQFSMLINIYRLTRCNSCLYRLDGEGLDLLSKLLLVSATCLRDFILTVCCVPRYLVTLKLYLVTLTLYLVTLTLYLVTRLYEFF